MIAHGVYSASEEAACTPPPTSASRGIPLFLAVGLHASSAMATIRPSAWCRPASTPPPAGWSRCSPPPGRRARGRPRRAKRASACWRSVIAAACPFSAIYVATILTETLAMFVGHAHRAARDQGAPGHASRLRAPLARRGSDERLRMRSDGRTADVRQRRGCRRDRRGTRRRRPRGSPPVIASGSLTALMHGRECHRSMRRPVCRSSLLTRSRGRRPATALGVDRALASAEARLAAPRGPRRSALTLGVLLVLAPWTVRNAAHVRRPRSR